MSPHTFDFEFEVHMALFRMWLHVDWCVENFNQSRIDNLPF